MANCYGTAQYEKFRKEQLDIGADCDWTPDEERYEQYGDYELSYNVYAPENKATDSFAYNRGVLKVRRNQKEFYSCADIYEDSPTFFRFFTWKGNDYLIFRKDDLYGYTIVNLNTCEEYNYFPDAVLDREQESFIIVDATLWNDVLLLDGCYWGCPYMYFLLDLNTYKTARLCERVTDNDKTVIEKNILTVRFDDEEEPKTHSFNYRDIEELLQNSDSYDI